LEEELDFDEEDDQANKIEVLNEIFLEIAS